MTSGRRKTSHKLIGKRPLKRRQFAVEERKGVLKWLKSTIAKEKADWSSGRKASEGRLKGERKKGKRVIQLEAETGGRLGSGSRGEMPKSDWEKTGIRPKSGGG